MILKFCYLIVPRIIEYLVVKVSFFRKINSAMIAF